MFGGVSGNIQCIVVYIKSHNVKTRSAYSKMDY